MKRLLCFLLSLQLVLSASGAALAAEFEIDRYAVPEGMGKSWYQGYEPAVFYNTMTLYLPVRGTNCVGSITASIALDDPNVFLLAAEPKAVTVSPKDGVYAVKLTLPLQSQRRNGDYPATITLRGTDKAGRELVERIPYVIRIRDGWENHETLKPVFSDVSARLDVGSDGSVRLTITNPTTTQSITDGEITVTDSRGDILMSGSHRVVVPEILPGKSETVEVPVSVSGNASISQHTLEVVFRYKALGADARWEETFTLPVTQAIRLEQGGVQLPAAIAGEMGNMTLPLMNMGKGTLQNVLVKLEMEGALNPQSVLVGTLAAGETKQAKLTFTPGLSSVGTHTGTVTLSCEDAYGNAFAQTLAVTLTVEEPIPEAQLQPEEEKEKPDTLTAVMIVLCVLLAAGLAVQGAILTGKLHKLEEERL